MAQRFQGMDVFWQVVKPQIQNRHEAALAVTHWILVGAGYKCVGHETELPTDKDQTRTGSELLPEKWNERTAGYYSLLYIHPEYTANNFLLKLIPAGSIADDVILGQILMSGDRDDVIPFELNSARFIPEQWSVYASPTSFPNFKALTDYVDNEILSKLQSKKRGEGTDSGARRDPGQANPNNHALFPRPMQPATGVPPGASPFAPLPAPPLSKFVPPGRSPFPGGIGSRDLDPFDGTGGNLFGHRDIFPGGTHGPGGGFPGRPYRYDPPAPPELFPGQRPMRGPFAPDPFGFPGGGGFGFPGGGGIGFPGGGGNFGPEAGIFGTGPRLPGRAPQRPFEPDPDHEVPPRPPGELPPRPPGDDPSNMFM